MMSDVLLKHPLVRLTHYLFLVPFIPVLRPLLVNFRIIDMSIYIGGMALVIFLVVYGNHLPLAHIHSDHIRLYLHYRHNAENHFFTAMQGYRRLSAHRLVLYSQDHPPVSLTMKKSDLEKLLNRLHQEGIFPRETKN